MLLNLTIMTFHLIFLVSISIGLLNLLEGCEPECFPYKVRDCQDVQYLGFTNSGVYHVTPDKTFVGYDVYCDMTTAGGGWLVFQRRMDGSVDFFRGWDDYVRGFGNNTGNLWLGNDALHTVTSQGKYELRVDLEDWEGNKTYAEFRIFKIASVDESYQLSVAGYTGDAGDSLSVHNGQAFATKDKDYTEHGPGNVSCTTIFQGAWWYKNCMSSNLNGVYLQGEQVHLIYHGVIWRTWLGQYYSLKRTEMKIRRK